MAHKKGLGSSRNGRESNPNMLGVKVFAGDVLLSIEAMKMETAIHAEADGVVAEVTVKPGDQIDAKDLLVRFE